VLPITIMDNTQRNMFNDDIGSYIRGMMEMPDKWVHE